MKAAARRVLGSVARVKLLIAMAAGALLVVVALLVIRQGAATVLSASEGADVRTTFRESLTAPVEIRNTISWLADRTSKGRSMEPQTRSDIADAYAQAWSAVDRASRGDPEAPVGEYLAGTALSHIRSQLADPAIRSTTVQTTHIAHKLELTFYSDDGSVVSLNAPEVIVERLVDATSTSDRELEATVATVARFAESYRLVMVLRDGNWRVELIERVGVGQILETRLNQGGR